MKSQWIRFLDVVFIGPLMVWGGMQARSKSEILGYTLAALGVGTVLYNGYNYLVVQEIKKAFEEGEL